MSERGKDIMQQLQDPFVHLICCRAIAQMLRGKESRADEKKFNCTKLRQQMSHKRGTRTKCANVKFRYSFSSLATSVFLAILPLLRMYLTSHGSVMVDGCALKAQPIRG